MGYKVIDDKRDETFELPTATDVKSENASFVVVDGDGGVLGIWPRDDVRIVPLLPV